MASAKPSIAPVNSFSAIGPRTPTSTKVSRYSVFELSVQTFWTNRDNRSANVPDSTSIVAQQTIVVQHKPRSSPPPIAQPRKSTALKSSKSSGGIATPPRSSPSNKDADNRTRCRAPSPEQQIQLISSRVSKQPFSEEHANLSTWDTHNPRLFESMRYLLQLYHQVQQKRSTTDARGCVVGVVRHPDVLHPSAYNHQLTPRYIVTVCATAEGIICLVRNISLKGEELEGPPTTAISFDEINRRGILLNGFKVMDTVTAVGFFRFLRVNGFPPKREDALMFQ